VRAVGSGVSCDPGGHGGGVSSRAPGTAAEKDGLLGSRRPCRDQPAAGRHGRLAIETW
jgi:hypothetical protein